MSYAVESVTDSPDFFSLGVEGFDVDTVLVFSEQRLWAAVALQLLDDYEAELSRTAYEWRRTKQPINSSRLMALRQMRREANGSWMRLILEHINVHGDHLLAKLDRLDKQYHLDEIQFTIYDEEINGLRKNLHIAR